MAGGWSVTLLFHEHSSVGNGLSVELRLAMILNTCYNGDVDRMLLKVNEIHCRTALAMEAGTFSIVVVVLVLVFY